MIRQHQFFEGSVTYRLDPKKAIDLLEIKAGTDIAPLTMRKSKRIEKPTFIRDVTSYIFLYIS